MMRNFLLALLLIGLASSGCARPQAKTTPDGPPLDMPAPPPRDVVATGADAPPPVPPEPARGAPPRARPAPAREQPRESRPEPAKPDAVPAVDAPKPETEAPPRTPSTLQTKPAGEEGDVERSVRVALTRANSDLSRVDYRTLNPDAKTQYDYAKRFIRQAEDALRAKNVVFAKTVADKASALAAQLAGR